ncbi:MAG TPA: zinc-dependent dehydrogenase [Anaerolineales bacterium]
MSARMLAAVYYGPDDLRVEERPVPEIGPGEALIRVASTGICGTDLRILHGAHRMYTPSTVRIPGHEVVGDIVEVGAEVKGLSPGQRVFVAPNMGCSHCRQCVSGNNNRCANYEAIGITLDGSFAEYLRVPAAAILQGNLIPVSAGLDPAAAALIEPFACVLRGQDALRIQPGEVVLVIGAGPIGVMHALLAQLRGARRVIVSEINPERVAQARGLGIDRVSNPEEEDLPGLIEEETNGEGADAVIVAAPSHLAQESAVELAAIGGRINFFGGLPKDRPKVNLNTNLIHYKELVVTGTTACSTDDCRRAAAIAGSKRIDLLRLVGRRYPLREARAAFAAAEDGKWLKVVMEP